MHRRSLTLAAFATSALRLPIGEAAAPTTLKYRIVQRMEQTFDASAMGLGEQKVARGYSAYLTVVVDDNGDRNAITIAFPARQRHTARIVWGLRRVHGKSRFLARMLRNALIFEGGVDYVLWKIQRHSGIETASAWREHRYPLLALGAHAWRLYRAGAFR